MERYNGRERTRYMILKDNYNFIGSDLRKIRESKGISRKEIAEKVYVSEETIRRIEKGENDPRLSTLIPICNCLGIELEDIINSSGFEYNNLLSLRKEINYHLNNSSIDKARLLISDLDDINIKSDLDFEKEFQATKHYFKGILALKSTKTICISLVEFEEALSSFENRFTINRFKNYKYDSFSLRILLALALAEQKFGNYQLYEDINLEISKYLRYSLEDYFLFSYNVGVYYYRAGKIIESLDLCNTAVNNAKKLKEVPYLNMVYYLKGVNHLSLNQLEEAKLSFNYCLALTNIFSEQPLAEKIKLQIDNLLVNYKQYL